MDFFNFEDIGVFRIYGGKRYLPQDARHQAIGKFIREHPMAKTAYWAHEVADRLPGFTMAIKSSWQKCGYFSRYSWARIFRPEDKDRDIFFTVGVDRDHKKGLVYKLDFQRDRSSELSDAKKRMCDLFITRHKLEWQTVVTAELNDFDWEKLIDATVDFISRHTDLYDEMVAQAWRRSARICWNTNNWLCPSGKIGKAPQKDSYERLYGYGNEEWLFDTGKLIDGCHYAFLEPVRQASDREVGEKYDTLLWTIDSRSKIRYAVADIRGMEIISEQESAKALAEYKQRGWLREMRKQVDDIGGDAQAFDKKIAFNIRFRPECVNVLYPAEIPAGNSVMRLKHYRLNRLQPDVAGMLSSERSVRHAFVGGRRSGHAAGAMTSYVSEAREVQMRHLHREISDGLTAFLAGKYGGDNVDQESTIGSRRIDIVLKERRGYVFYEIKTYPSLRTSVREALGQLLEYAHYPESDNACKLVIVTQSTHSDRSKRDAQRYVARLRKLYHLPICLRYFDMESKTLSVAY